MIELPPEGRAFHNRLRILLNIEAGELSDAGVRLEHWPTFAADPFRFFIRADDRTAAAIWSIVEARESRRKPA